MKSVRFLSYPLTKVVPAYGNDSYQIDIKRVKSIDKADSCNVYWFGMENHIGTHVDAPAHFFNQGMSVVNYPADTWIFSSPHVVDVSLNENEVLKISHLENIPLDTDLILIKSGFYKNRGTYAYSCCNPGIEPEVAFWIREYRPSVRALGCDFISVSPYQNRELGRRSHQAFLDPKGVNHPILIVEDMDLSGSMVGLSSVLIAPILFEGIDSAPCSVYGIYSEESKKI